MPRMATASMISRRVNPFLDGLTLAINIKFDLSRLALATPHPFHRQVYHSDPAHLQTLFIPQPRWSGFWNQRHCPLTRVDFCFLAFIGQPGRHLNLRHPVRQNLAHAVVFRGKIGRSQAILDRAAQDKDADAKNRHAEEDLVKRESPRQAFSAPHSSADPPGPSGPSISPSRSHWAHDTSPRPVRSCLTARKPIPTAVPPRSR